VKDNWVNFIIFAYNGEDCNKSIVKGIYFHNKLSIRDPVDKNGHRGECLLQGVESIITGVVKILENILLSKMNWQ